jgi:hypothetical protein
MSTPGLALRRIGVIGALVLATAVPQLAVAQATEGEPAAEETPSLVVEVEAPPPMVNVEAVEEAPIVEPPPPPAPPVPVVRAAMTPLVYLGNLQYVRSGWLRSEANINNLVRQQRLGVLPPGTVQSIAGAYPGIVSTLDGLFTGLTPPPQFAHVHQLHVAAGAEFNAATVSFGRWAAGDQRGLADMQGAFARFDRLIGQALLELG